MHTQLVLPLLAFSTVVYAFGKHLSPEESLKEDMTLDPVEFITKYGNKAENHEVITEDGYILGIHRMLPQDGAPPKNYTVFLMHGIGASSFDWLVLGPKKSLPHILSAKGFDVWLGNARGNLYSTKHVTLDPRINSSQFWNFSWHQIGVYDLPATIDYILNVTKTEMLHYIGHSQGTTVFFVMCSMKPDYNKKIKTMNALSPVVFMSRMQSPIAKISDYAFAADAAFQVISFNDFPKLLLSKFGYQLCNEKSTIAEVCDNMIFLIGGYNSLLYNKTMAPLLLSHFPAGFSMKQLIHYNQEIASKKFRQFDFSLGNIVAYGSLEPPEYELQKVTAPVALHWSDGDPLSHPLDVHELSVKLPTVVLNRKVPFHNFSHINYMWAIRAKEYVYDAVLDVIGDE